jgi:hypothetical protein
MALPMSPESPQPALPSNVTPITQAPSAPSSRDKNVQRRREAATKARESFAKSHRYTRPIREDTELAARIRQLFFDSRAQKRKLLNQWNANYKFLRNRPQELGMNIGGAPMVPEIFPIISSTVGGKSDRRITNTVSSSAITHTPYWLDTSDLAADLATILDATWSVNQEEREVGVAVWDSEVYGTGFLKTAWHPDLAGGLGDAKMMRVDPYTVYPDPAARSMADMNYIIEVRTMSLQEMDRRWPGSARVVKVGALLDQSDEAPDQLHNRSQLPRANAGAITPGNIPTYGMVGGGFLSALTDPGVTVMEAWLRCSDAVEDETAPYGYRTEETWRVVVVAGSHILMDEPATNLWSHGRHPYTRLICADVGEFWGFSTVELLIPTQRSINRILGAFETNALLTGNPTMVDDTRAGISRTQTTNRPGQRLTVGVGGKVDWLKPPPMSQAQPELLRYMLQRMEAVSGLAAVTRGGSMPGRNAQGVMDAMQEAAFVRIRTELLQLQFALTDAGRLKSSLIIDNYTEPRNMAIIGPDGAQKMLATNARHFLIPTSSGEVPLEYTLLVDAGASQHTGRKAREDQVLGLANMGILDAQAVLEALDFPGRAEIIKRLQAQQQQMMAAGIDPNKK